MAEQIVQDIDIYGRENTDGSAKEHFGEEAVKVALTLWLTSKRGDFILNPTAGGILDTQTFKNMSEGSLNLLKFKIKNAINLGFIPEIELKKINLIPDYVNRVLEIQITYSSPRTNEIENISIYTKDKAPQESFVYKDVIYVEENLRNFCLTVKDAQEGKKLIYDADVEKWKWGKYLLLNLTYADSYFDEILSICNDIQ